MAALVVRELEIHSVIPSTKRRAPPHNQPRDARNPAGLAVLDHHSSSEIEPMQLHTAKTEDVLVLEQLLSRLVSKPDSLARELVDRFGSIFAIAEATEKELRLVSRGERDWVAPFIVARKLISWGLKERVFGTKLDGATLDLRRHLLASMRGLRTERMHAIFADVEGNVLAEEIVGEGHEGHLQLSLRRIFARALAFDARRMILAHNHPSGCPEPSVKDIVNTKKLAEHARSLGISLEDHLVVGRTAVISMKDRGLF